MFSMFSKIGDDIKEQGPAITDEELILLSGEEVISYGDLNNIISQKNMTDAKESIPRPRLVIPDNNEFNHEQFINKFADVNSDITHGGGDEVCVVVVEEEGVAVDGGGKDVAICIDDDTVSENVVINSNFCYACSSISIIICGIIVVGKITIFS